MTQEKFEKFLKELEEKGYNNTKLFGKKFKPLTKKTDCLKKDCPINFLKFNKKIHKNGKIKSKYVDEIDKRYLWMYITYIRAFNKDEDIFKIEYKDEKNKIIKMKNVNSVYLYYLIKKNLPGQTLKRSKIDKKTLNKFINKIIKDNKNIKIPMLKD
tara:strand:- start:461 stop:928 length:468 start_codon:yes stop_codon:yes gene_type:complete